MPNFKNVKPLQLSFDVCLKMQNDYPKKNKKKRMH